MMNILDERPHFASSLAFPEFSPLLLLVLDVVARERLAQDRNQWCVSGKEYAVETVEGVLMFGGGVETHQRLAGSGNSGHEADRFESPFLRRSDDVGDCVGG